MQNLYSGDQMDWELACLKKYATSQDADAFAELVRIYSGMVFAAAQRVTEDLHLAEDVTQNTFLALARNADRIRTSVGSWLHLTATHRALDAVRSRRRAATHERAATIGRDSEVVSDVPIEWSALSPLIDKAIVDLPSELRSPLVLHYLQSLSQEQVAAELGINQSTVSRRLTQAIDRLRSQLRKDGVIGAAALPEFLSYCGPQPVPPGLPGSLTKIGLSGYGTMLTTSSIKLLSATAIVFLLIGFVGWALWRPHASASPIHPVSQIAPTTLPAPLLSPSANDEMMRSIATACGKSAAKVASISYDFALTLSNKTDGKSSITNVSGHIDRDGKQWRMDYTQHTDPKLVDVHPDGKRRSADGRPITSVLNFTERAFFSEGEFGEWLVGSVNPNLYKHRDPTRLPQIEMGYVDIFLDYDLFSKAFRLLDRPRDQPFNETALADISDKTWRWQCNPNGQNDCTLYGWPSSRPATQLPYLTAEYTGECGFFTLLKFTMGDGKLARTIEVVPAQVQESGIWYPAMITETAYNLGNPNTPYSTTTFMVSHVSIPMKSDPKSFTIEGLHLSKEADVIVIDNGKIEQQQ